VDYSEPGEDDPAYRCASFEDMNLFQKCLSSQEKYLCVEVAVLQSLGTAYHLKGAAERI